MAFGAFDSNNHKEMSEINVTPLVDVMLVLLIVFMITMPVLTNSIPLELPTASVETQKEPPHLLRVAINQTGLYLDNQALNEENLKTTFEQYGKENPDTVIAISADSHVEYENVVKVLELAQNAGLKKIGFVTQPEK